MSAPQLLQRARDGVATDEDVRHAADLLAAGQRPGDRYDLLLVIGETNSTQYRRVVEGYLDFPDDPMLSRLAIEILCGWWGTPEPYRDHVLRFVAGVDWDVADGGYVRQVATSAAGEYLRTREDPRLMRALIDLLADGEAPLLDRAVAYEAIQRAVGKGYAEIPRSHRGDWHQHLDQAVMAEARRRAEL